MRLEIKNVNEKLLKVTPKIICTLNCLRILSENPNNYRHKFSMFLKLKCEDFRLIRFFIMFVQNRSLVLKAHKGQNKLKNTYIVLQQLQERNKITYLCDIVNWSVVRRYRSSRERGASHKLLCWQDNFRGDVWGGIEVGKQLQTSMFTR